MSSSQTNQPLDRYTNIGELSEKVRKALKAVLIPMAIVMALESTALILTNAPGGSAFALMCAGTFCVFLAWSNNGIGLPLMPMMAAQTLIIYGVPIVAKHDTILAYPNEFVFSAGIEVLVFCLALALAWLAGLRMTHPSPPISYALHELNKSGVKGWARLGFGMIVSSTVAQILEGLGILNGVYALLPSGSESIISALIAVGAASGFFLVSMIIGGGVATYFEKLLFWGILISNAVLSAEDFILATAAAYLITVSIGLFWSSGKIPWKYLTMVMVALSFLNTGKTTMRTRYWENADQPGKSVTLVRLPEVMAEWVEVSYDAILANNTSPTASTKFSGAVATKNQTLLDRIDNLQNLLFVIDAVKTSHVTLLGGQTYSIIPPLLIPRVFWPDKPRSHEGQILLNVHFGRQDLESTFTTYIAWGLLAEAYGNFGPILGATFLGCVLGFAFAMIENFTKAKLIVSIEGFLSIALLMNLMNSFEMVASVFVTATFQSMVIIAAASMPFVQRTVNVRVEQSRDSSV
ncbi:MAG TPA: hypothetical protein VFE25_06560 [Opitutaceae bacterium]|jgi:hypothetical protein|nr:hypothetical protein [Opitutaceae bacterium]